MGDRPRPGSARDHDKPCVGCGEPIPFTGDNDDQRVCAACAMPDSITPVIERQEHIKTAYTCLRINTPLRGPELWCAAERVCVALGLIEAKRTEDWTARPGNA